MEGYSEELEILLSLSSGIEELKILLTHEVTQSGKRDLFTGDLEAFSLHGALWVGLSERHAYADRIPERASTTEREWNSFIFLKTNVKLL